jgi:hypothetical protein
VYKQSGSEDPECINLQVQRTQCINSQVQRFRGSENPECNTLGLLNLTVYTLWVFWTWLFIHSGSWLLNLWTWRFIHSGSSEPDCLYTLGFLNLTVHTLWVFWTSETVRFRRPRVYKQSGSEVQKTQSV